jgi:hypothetical protein
MTDADHFPLGMSSYRMGAPLRSMMAIFLLRIGVPVL